MSNFKTYIIGKWDNLSLRDKSINWMAALKAASLIKEGSHCSVEELNKATEQILEHFWEFDWMSKPARDNKAVGREVDKINQEIDEAVEEKKGTKHIPF